MTDVLHQLVLLVLLPLVVFVQLQPALLRHGRHPLGAEAAQEDCHDAQDEEGCSPALPRERRRVHLIYILTIHILFVIIGI